MSELAALALRLASDVPVKTLSTTRLVSALFNGEYVVRTTEAVLVWEVPFYPQLYVPFEALSDSFKIKTEGDIRDASGKLVARQLKLTVGDRSTDQAFQFDDLEGAAAPLSGLVKITFAALDQWFEESTPIYVHPKDPFKRVDILQSTRPVRVLIDGVEVANAVTSMHLYETGLPPRFYLPRVSLRQDLLRPSSTKTKCPYKGEAEYFSVQVNGKLHEDVVWYYRQPLLESIKIEDLCCFYNEKVDIELDGKMLDRPVSPFANRKPSQKPPSV